MRLQQRERHAPLREGLPGLPSAEELAKQYNLPTTNYWGEPVSYADVFRQLPHDTFVELMTKARVNSVLTGEGSPGMFHVGVFAKPPEDYYYGWTNLAPEDADEVRTNFWAAVRAGWNPFSNTSTAGGRDVGSAGASSGKYYFGGSKGGAGGNPYVRSSGSESQAFSFAGIPYELIRDFSAFASKRLGLLGSLMDDIKGGKGSQEVFSSLDKYNQLALDSWRKARADLVNAMMKEGITSLANRGVLDSSVATGLLSNIARQNLQDLSKFQSQLGLNQIMQSLYYPLKALKTISRPYVDIAGLTKFAMSGSRSSADSYDPSPWVSLIMALAGI